MPAQGVQGGSDAGSGSDANSGSATGGGGTAGAQSGSTGGAGAEQAHADATLATQRLATEQPEPRDHDASPEPSPGADTTVQPAPSVQRSNATASTGRRQQWGVEAEDHHRPRERYRWTGIAKRAWKPPQMAKSDEESDGTPPAEAEVERAREAQEERDIAEHNRVLWHEQQQPFVEEILQNGLPSARSRTAGTGPALKLHSVRRAYNTSSTEF